MTTKNGKLEALMGAWDRLDPEPSFHAPESLDLAGAVVGYDASILFCVYGYTTLGNPVSVTLHIFHVTHPARPTLWIVEAWSTTPAVPPTLPALWSVADSAALAIARAIAGVRDISEARQASAVAQEPTLH